MPRIKTLTPDPESGLTPSEAAHVFDRIAQFAGYGFNKSHAAAYAAISYHTAYLRTHFPEAFFAASMNLCLDNVEDIAAHAADLRRRGLVLDKPAILRAGATFQPDTVQPGRILYGLSAIRGVGRSAAEAIVADRQANGPYESLDSAMARLRPIAGRSALVALAKAGAFDCLRVKRNVAIAHAKGPVDAAPAAQTSLFDMMEDAAPVYDVQPLSRSDGLDLEFDVLGHYHTGHPFDPAPCPLARVLERIATGGPAGAIDVAIPAIVTVSDSLRTNDGKTIGMITIATPGDLRTLRASEHVWPRISRIVAKKARLLLDLRVLPGEAGARVVLRDARPLDLDDDARAA